MKFCTQIYLINEGKMNARKKTREFDVAKPKWYIRRISCTLPKCAKPFVLCATSLAKNLWLVFLLMAQNAKSTARNLFATFLKLKRMFRKFLLEIQSHAICMLRFTAANCIRCTQKKSHIEISFDEFNFFSFNLMCVLLVIFYSFEAKTDSEKIAYQLKRKSTLMSALCCIINICRMKSQVKISLV